VKVLVAPDKFKHALSAAEAAEAIADGVVAACPTAHVIQRPLADGGEGAGAILAAALNAAERSLVVHDALGRPHRASWWLAAEDRTAVVELAQAAGLGLLAANERDPWRASTYGVGQLLAEAAKAAARILLCVGGSATIDGGVGCLQAIGWQLLDACGRPLPSPAAPAQLLSIRALRPPARAWAVPLEVLCDVDNPLLGESGAAAVYGPQKGAAEAMVRDIEAGLAHWSALLAEHTGVLAAQLPGAGAAGGLPAGLAAALGARLSGGFDQVARCVGLDRAMQGCDLCLTGEGRLDEQTARGKVVCGVARHAAQCGVPAVALVGAVAASGDGALARVAAQMGLQRIVVITPPGAAPAAALREARANLRRAAAAVVGR